MMTCEIKTIACIVAMIWGVLVLALPAATYTWDGGGGDNHWGTLANWDPDMSDVSELTGADLVFTNVAGSAGGTATTPAVANNDQVGLSIHGLVFTNFPATSTGWLLTGNGITVNAGGISNMVSTANKSVIISNDIAVGASHTWRSAADTPLTLAGNLTSGAGVTVDLISTTDNRLILSGSNSGFAGNIVFNATGSRLTLSYATAMIGGNIDMGSSGNARLWLSGSDAAGTYTFGLGTGAGEVNTGTSPGCLASLLDGRISWDPGNGGDFIWNSSMKLGIAGSTGDFEIGNSSSRIVLTGGNISTYCNNNYSAGPVLEFKGALSDDGSARTLTIHGSHLVILTQPQSGANAASKLVGRVAFSNMNQLFPGNLSNSGKVFILDNVSWSDFLAGRPSGYGSGDGQFSGASFAARTADLVIDSVIAGFSFDVSFTIGSPFRRYGDSMAYADKSVIITLDTTLSAVRTITPDGYSLTTSRDPAYTVQHRIEGDLSGAGALVVGGNAQELVLAGHNTWSGTPTVSSSTTLSAGPGGLATIAGIVRFDDTELSSGTSIPQGNAGADAYLATWADNAGGSGVRGFVLTGDSDGQVYKLPTGMKMVLAASGTSLGNSWSGMFGSIGADATLSDSAIVAYIGNDTSVCRPLMFVRDVALHLGDGDGPVMFQRATGVAGTGPAASTFTEAGTTGANNNEIRKIGRGTLILDNIAYTDLSGAGDYSSNHKWTLGSGSASAPSFTFDGAVRETGNTAATSIRGNSSLGVTVMQGGVIEIASGATAGAPWNMQLGTGAGQLNMGGVAGGGFAAFGDYRVVALVNSQGVANGPIYMDNSGLNVCFVDNDQPLILGSVTSDNTVEITNPIYTDGGNGGSYRYIATVRGTSTGPEGILSGVLTGANKTMRFISMRTPWGSALPAGTVVLSGTSPSLTTELRVEAGSVLINGEIGVSATKAVTVYSGATLGGTGVINRAVTVESGGILAPGNLNSVGTLTVNGDLTMAEGSALNWNGAAGANDGVEVSGTVTLPSAMTVNVSGTGQFASPTLLFEAGALAGAVNLNGWTVTGSPGATVAIDGTTVMLVAENEGTIFFIQSKVGLAEGAAGSWSRRAGKVRSTIEPTVGRCG